MRSQAFPLRLLAVAPLPEPPEELFRARIYRAGVSRLITGQVDYDGETNGTPKRELEIRHIGRGRAEWLWISMPSSQWNGFP
jgi:hypothetical protein